MPSILQLHVNGIQQVIHKASTNVQDIFIAAGVLGFDIFQYLNVNIYYQETTVLIAGHGLLVQPPARFRSNCMVTINYMLHSQCATVRRDMI